MKKFFVLAVIVATTLVFGTGCGANPNVPPTASDNGGDNGGSTSGGGGEASTVPQGLRAAREGDRFLRMGWFRLAEAAHRVAVELGAGPVTGPRVARSHSLLLSMNALAPCGSGPT